MTEAAPGPVFGLFYQAALHRIAMHVAQFLDTLALTPDVEVVVTRCQKRLPSKPSMRAVVCFSDWISDKSGARAGSLSSR